jgi:MYXO-CTERM domain-containing protein
MMLGTLLTAAALAAGQPALSSASPSNPNTFTPATPAVTLSTFSDQHIQITLDKHGLVHRLSGSLGQLQPGEQGAISFLRAHAADLSLRADENFKVLMDDKDARGGRHLRIGRRLFNLEVAFDQIRLHANADGSVYLLESELSDLHALHYSAPRVTPWQAEKVARAGYPGKLTEPARPTLVVLGNSIFGVETAHLAYRTRIHYPRTNKQVPVVQSVYVDALSGLRLKRLQMVFTDGTPTTVSQADLNGNTVQVNAASYTGTSGAGLVLKDIVTLQNSGQIYTLNAANQNNVYASNGAGQPFVDGSGQADPQAISAAENVYAAVNFDAQTFGWTNWDFNSSPSGNGGTLAGIAHTGDHLNNAYFVTQDSNGQTIGTMNYGDGDGQEFTPLAKALDVTGHEMGHGIVQGTAGLVYETQSGALNEHMADVFGWLLDSSNDTIGETVVGPSLQPALRDMCNPHQNVQQGDPRWQPAVMSEFQQLPDTEDGDNGGVHTNSGIPNHAACLVRDAVAQNNGGDKSAGFAVVGKVWFEALKHHLGSTASFADMVSATESACAVVDDATGPNCLAVAQAWVTVGLATSTSTCGANATAVNGTCTCNDGYTLDPTGTQCIQPSNVTCPVNAHVDTGMCFCNEGYAPDGSGNCAPDTGGANCPTNSHAEGNNCVCNQCFQGSVAGDCPPGSGNCGCQPIQGCQTCSDPLQVWDPAQSACVCIQGMTLQNGTCTAVPGQCGAENWAGRCVDNLLIFCDNVDNPESIQTDDCFNDEGGKVCGLDKVNGGYDCVAPQSNCGSVPANGQCSGDTAQVCENGILQTVDCADAGCSAFTYDNQQYNYCTPSNVSGGTSGTPGGGSTSGSSGSSGGCGCGSLNEPTPSYDLWLGIGLVGLAVFVLRRRR